MEDVEEFMQKYEKEREKKLKQAVDDVKSPNSTL